MCGVLLVPWIGVLIEQLHGQAGKRSFNSSWVGLDVLEAVCLLIVAVLLSRRHRATSPVAAATAAILCMDAWFDTMSAAPQLPYAESLAMACFAELPLAALASAAFPKLVVSGGHSAGFDAICDELAERIGASRMVIEGAGHEIQFTGEPLNDELLTLWRSVS